MITENIKKEGALAKEFTISAGGTALQITPHKERSVGDYETINTNECRRYDTSNNKKN